MKPLRLIVLLAVILSALLLPTVASAKCMSEQLNAWPPHESTLPTNGHILLEGYGGLQRLALEASDIRYALKTDRGDVIPMRVVEVNEGGYRVSQVWLAPVRALPAGARVELIIDDGAGPRTPMIWDKGAESAQTWIVGEGPDDAAPTWRGAATVKGSSYRRMGCGPSTHVELEAPASDDGAVLIRATVSAVADPSQVSTYLLPVAADGVLLLGHGMCSGAFELVPNGDYTVTLSAVDGAGHSTPAPGPTLSISGPAPTLN